MLPSAVTLSSRSLEFPLTDLVSVAVDVGKSSAMAQVCDFSGRTLVRPFEFAMDAEGVAELVRATQDSAPSTVQLIRAGVEAAGHYHLPLLGERLPAGWDVRVLNPAHVAQQRKARGRRGVKTDRVDLEAITDLLLANRGLPVPAPNDVLGELRAWVAQRDRRSLVRRGTINQLTTQVDRAFPGLGRALSSVATTKVGRLIVRESCDPRRIGRMGPERLRAFAARRGLRVSRPMAERLCEAARRSIPAPGARSAAELARRDLALLEVIEAQLAECEERLGLALAASPFAVLTTVPGWASVTAAAYGAAVGEPTRYSTPHQIYRASGLTPRLYESSGRRRDGGICREGSPALRRALMAMGTGLWLHEPSAAARAAQMRARGKPGGIITTALANRANRIAFAMVRDQAPYDGDRWAA